MDIKQFMILVQGKDKTSEIELFSRDATCKKIEVKYYKNKKYYLYKEENITILQNPRIVDLKNKTAYWNDMPIYELRCVLDFGEKVRIIQSNGCHSVVEPGDFYVIEKGTNGAEWQQTLEYLRDIAQYTGDLQEKETFLKQEMDKLEFVSPDSVLGSYLSRRPIEIHRANLEDVIFPFSFNLSQKEALERAFTSSISVIEGPPGTGKTQTILNILVNLAVREKSVAVVSNNNEAVKNIIRKMEKNGYGFLVALLGKKENQELFFSNMPVSDVDGWDCEEKEEELLETIKTCNVRLMGLMSKERMKAKLEQELRAWKLEGEHFEVYCSRKEVEKIAKLPLLCRTPEKILSFLAETSIAKEYQQTKSLLYRIKLLFKFGIFDIKKLNQQEVAMLLTMQEKYYQLQIQRLEQRIAELNTELEKHCLESLKEVHQETSEKLFRKYLHRRYKDHVKLGFTKNNYKVQFDNFIKTYPILLSTTYTLRRSIPQNYLLDYVIIDEASQVDLITGVLAFSCCKNVIIVGDLKQLSQITDKKIKDRIQTSPPGDQL